MVKKTRKEIEARMSAISEEIENNPKENMNTLLAPELYGFDEERMRDTWRGHIGHVRYGHGDDSAGFFRFGKHLYGGSECQLHKAVSGRIISVQNRDSPSGENDSKGESYCLRRKKRQTAGFGYR